MICLVFTALLTPYEVCLLGNNELNTWYDILLFVINQVVNIFFIIDIFIQFFLAYQEDAIKGGRWITDKSMIKKHYLRTWFSADLLSCIPFDFMTAVNIIPTTGGTSVLKIIRAVRLVRLVKLLRILRASRILSRWQAHFGITYASSSIIKFFFMTGFLVHMMACTWAYIGINWEGASNPQFLPDGATPLDSSWLLHQHLSAASNRSDTAPRGVIAPPFRVYAVALYNSVVGMFGGGGDVIPRNNIEYNYYVFSMLFGSMVWAWVVGSLCGILATLDPHGAAHKNTMDELNHFLHEHLFDTAMKVRLRDFLMQRKYFSRIHASDALLGSMSAQLRGDTAVHVGKSTLSKVWYFQYPDLEQEFLALMALNLSPAIFQRGEQLPTDKLTVIIIGVAARRLHIYVKGSILGIDFIIEQEHDALREQTPANCLTFVQSTSISRQAVFGLLDHFPVAYERLRHASLKLTLRGAFVKFFDTTRSSSDWTPGPLTW